MKEFKFTIGEDIYLIKLEMGKESLIINGIKNDIASNISFKAEYPFQKIIEMNQKFKNFHNNEDFFNFISNNLFESSKITIRLESNYLVISNKDKNIQFNLEKCIPDENEVLDDIFNKISLLEAEIHNFSNFGKNLTNTLNEYENKLEKMKKNN